MLNNIRDKLETLGLGKVRYGRAERDPESCNYVVFARNTMKRSGTSKRDYNRYYTVVVVHEDYIPEGTEQTVIAAMNEIPGLKLSQNDIQYDYLVKKNSDTVVEMVAMQFFEVVKGYTV